MSTPKKKGLGRGLSALFGDEKFEPKEKEIINNKHNVSIGDLNRNRYQPRMHFDEAKLDELVQSIKKNGIIQPIAVRPDKGDPGRFEIVAGERRWLAAQKAGLHEVPVIVLDLEDNEALEVAIVENIQRDDLNIIEESKAYKRLADEFGYDHEKIARFMSKSRSHISNTLRLLTLPSDVVGMIEEGNLTAGQARPLIGLINASEIAEQIVSNKMSARKVEMFIRAEKGPQKVGNRLDANIINEQNKIEENLGLKVTINNKRNNSGKLSIEYNNLEQFDFISNLLKKR
jgi:ParB family chromosome partitioning protein